MLLSTNGVDLMEIRSSYEEIAEMFDDLIEGAKDEAKERKFRKAFELFLAGFVEKTFSVNPDYFIQEAFREICFLKNVDEEQEFSMSVLSVYRFKLGHILGSDNPQVEEIYYKNVVTKH